MPREIEFKIDLWTPETIPQVRLGEYLVAVSNLYGETTGVHFSRLRKGSAVLVSTIDETAFPKVERRLFEIRAGQGQQQAVGVFRRIDEMLALDNAVGSIRLPRGGGGIVMKFPGRDRLKPIEYAAIREEGYLEGEIIKIGGRERTIHVTLQDDNVIYTAIETNRSMARLLGPLIFGPTVRLYGEDNWRRDPDGKWTLDRFVIGHFEQNRR